MPIGVVLNKMVGNHNHVNIMLNSFTGDKNEYN